MSVVRLPGWKRRAFGKAAMKVTTDPDRSKAAIEATPDSRGSTSGNPRPPTHPEPSASACEPYRELVELGMRRGRNAMAIWQGLISDHGFAGSYQMVKRFARRLRGPQGPEPAGIILSAAGEEVQADYGGGPMVRDPQNGKYRWTRLFASTLGYSRKPVIFRIKDTPARNSVFCAQLVRAALIYHLFW